MNQEQLKERIRDFPDNPGVYVMKDRLGKVIYVGKAKRLKRRVASYFVGSKDQKTSHLIRRIDSIESIITNTEYEALLLENNLIKAWSPRYNINLKDGKSYPVIRITAEPFPRVFRTRRIIQDGSAYFGPYPSAGALDACLELVNRSFRLRKCRGRLKKRSVPCLYYHIHQCSAPCIGKVNEEEYAGEVEKVKEILAGDGLSHRERLKAEMEQAAEARDFERAAALRDILQTLKEMGDDQGVVHLGGENQDYVCCLVQGELFAFGVFSMRGGKLLGRDLYLCQSPSEPSEAFLDFLIQYYSRRREEILQPGPASGPNALGEKLPARIFIEAGPESAPESGAGQVNRDLLKRFFEDRLKAEPLLLGPEEKKDRAVMNMLKENLREEMARRLRSLEKPAALEELQRILNLPKLPRRIEGFDIAQLHGKFPVASLVSFYNGRADKAAYRYFRLRTTQGVVDDYESIREAVARRYTRVINEKLSPPDLILIDGGRGQVSAAKGILLSLGLGEIPVAGLAKQNEEIFLPRKKNPLVLEEGSPALKILQAVRDESHRFATSLNQKLRLASIGDSPLEGAPGIGPVRSRKLLQFYGSLEAISRAPAEEVAEMGGFSLEVARAVADAAKKALAGREEGPPES
jgi:excinuclease ABC subunit C